MEQSVTLRWINKNTNQMNESLFQGRMLAPFESPVCDESELVKRLMKSLAFARKKLSDVPESYLASEVWKKVIEEEWSRYYLAIENNDVELMTTFLRNIFRNEGISGFWGGKNMFGDFASLLGEALAVSVNSMVKQFAAWRDALPDVPLAEVAAPRIGNPWGYVFDGNLVYQPAFEYNYQAHYFKRLLSPIAQPVVLEIGGGFGGLGYHILKNIPGVTYIGFDLPENILVQSYYLSSAFPELKVFVLNEDFERIDRTLLDEYDIVLLPNFALPFVDTSLVDLVANVRSLSEMGVPTIHEYFSQILRIDPLFFFHENLDRPRRDGLYGTPSTKYPVLDNFVCIVSSESRWPRYQRSSPYPCSEQLFINKRAYDIVAI